MTLYFKEFQKRDRSKSKILKLIDKKRTFNFDLSALCDGKCMSQEDTKNEEGTEVDVQTDIEFKIII